MPVPSRRVTTVRQTGRTVLLSSRRAVRPVFSSDDTVQPSQSQPLSRRTPFAVMPKTQGRRKSPREKREGQALKTFSG